MGVVCGLPPVPTPWAEVTPTRSFTIEVTDGSRVGEVLPPAGTVSPLQTARPLDRVPPLLADPNVVLTGTRSLIPTPVASALPTLRTLMVYVRSLPGPTGTPLSTVDTTRAGEAFGLAVVNAPRPCVPAARVRCDGS